MSTNKPDPTNSQGDQRLRVEDALTYLDKVKLKYNSQNSNTDVYNSFLDIMKDFKSHTIDTPGVIRRVSQLFNGENELIEDFNSFLPPGYVIKVRHNSIYIDEPQGHYCLMLPKFEKRVINSKEQFDHELIYGPKSWENQRNRQMSNQNSNKPIGANPLQVQAPRKIQVSNNNLVNSDDPLQKIIKQLTNTQNVKGTVTNNQNNPQQQLQDLINQQNNSNQVGNIQKIKPIVVSKNTNKTNIINTTSAGKGILLGNASNVNDDLKLILTNKNNQNQSRTGSVLESDIINKSPQIANNNNQNQNQAQQNERTGQPEFDHAINYVNKIKDRFQLQPHVYKQFLEILHSYQQDTNKTRKMETVVYKQVAQLFQNNDDLLQEFGQFLPETGIAQIHQQQMQLKAQKMAEAQGGGVSSVNKTLPVISKAGNIQSIQKISGGNNANAVMGGV